MGCCRDISTAYLHVFNAIVMVFGILILAMGAYLASTVDEDFKEVGFSNPIIASLVFGSGLVLFSIIGIVGTCYDNSCLLLIYIIGVLFLGVSVLASGIVLLVFAGKFEDVQDGQVENGVEARIMDFELAMFNECCVKRQDDVVFPVLSCDNPLSFQTLCVTDEERFDEFSELFDDDTCEVLEENLELDGKPLIGPATDLNGGCGNGFASVFVNRINQYVEDNLTTLGAINVVAGCVLLILLVAACVVLWTKNEEKKRQEANKKSPGCM